MTKIFYESNLNNEHYREIATILSENGTFIYPTETVYGLGCRGDNSETVKKIAEIKQRRLSKDFILLFKNIEMLQQYVIITSDKEKNLIKKYWPGELTIVLQAISGGTMACRISPYPFIKNLFNYIDFPIVSTSANISNNGYTGKIDEIINTFAGKIDIIINAGSLFRKTPSTIVKVTNNRVIILRQGKLFLPD